MTLLAAPAPRRSAPSSSLRTSTRSSLASTSTRRRAGRAAYVTAAACSWCRGCSRCRARRVGAGGARAVRAAEPGRAPRPAGRACTRDAARRSRAPPTAARRAERGGGRKLRRRAAASASAAPPRCAAACSSAATTAASSPSTSRRASTSPRSSSRRASAAAAGGRRRAAARSASRARAASSRSTRSSSSPLPTRSRAPSRRPAEVETKSYQRAQEKFEIRAARAPVGHHGDGRRRGLRGCTAARSPALASDPMMLRVLLVAILALAHGYVAPLGFARSSSPARRRALAQQPRRMTFRRRRRPTRGRGRQRWAAAAPRLKRVGGRREGLPQLEDPAAAHEARHVGATIWGVARRAASGNFHGGNPSATRRRRTASAWSRRTR